MFQWDRLPAAAILQNPWELVSPPCPLIFLRPVDPSHPRHMKKADIEISTCNTTSLANITPNHRSTTSNMVSASSDLQCRPYILTTETITGPNSPDKAQNHPRKSSRTPRQPPRPAQSPSPHSPSRRRLHRIKARQATNQTLILRLPHPETLRPDGNTAQEPQAPREAPPGGSIDLPDLPVRRPPLADGGRGARG